MLRGSRNMENHICMAGVQKSVKKGKKPGAESLDCASDGVEIWYRFKHEHQVLPPAKSTA